jgi:hypothetical protein
VRVLTDAAGVRVLVESGGTALGDAAVAADGRAVRLQITLRGRHLTGAARRTLVDAVFALPELAAQCAVEAAIPLGDAELLAALQSRLTDVHTRAAGSTCLIDARAGRVASPGTGRVTAN